MIARPERENEFRYYFQSFVPNYRHSYCTLVLAGIKGVVAIRHKNESQSVEKFSEKIVKLLWIFLSHT